MGVNQVDTTAKRLMSNYGKASAPEVIYSSIFQDLITLSKRSPPPLNSIQLSSKTRPTLLFRNAFYHYFQAWVMQRRIRYKNSAQMDKNTSQEVDMG